MSLCETCPYRPWNSSNPISEDDYLERLASVEITPSGEGLKRIGIGSPFRVPLPLFIELCCLDEQMCTSQEVRFSSISKMGDANVVINNARIAVYEEVGLPAISES